MDKSSVVLGVIGLGYVGLPLALRFCEVGFKVIGFDTDPAKVVSLQENRSYLQHIDHSVIEAAMAGGFEPTTDFAKINSVDTIIICVPTPLTSHREPDLSFVVQTMDSIQPYLKKGQLLSLESTTYPGTTEEVLLPYLERSGFTVGEDIFLVYSPEREDPGNAKYGTKTIPKILGGYTPACSELGRALYSAAIDEVVMVSSPKVAELTKLLENIHRAVNIGLVNEMKVVADKMGIDIHEVIDAAATKPFGFTPYYPGPGLGGHCIPIDPFYLTWKAREYGINTRFIELAGEVNTAMPAWVVAKLVEALNDRCKSVKGSRILILGLAYKKNVSDLRESPSMRLMQLLLDKGAMVDYSDPHIPKIPALRNYDIRAESVPLTAVNLSLYDCVLLATDHDAFDYELIGANAALIIDTRARFREAADNIIRA